MREVIVGYEAESGPAVETFDGGAGDGFDSQAQLRVIEASEGDGAQ